MKLTVGMACYKDFDGVYFTVQSLQMYHDLNDVEILIVDNFGDVRLESWVKAWSHGKIRYEKFTEVIGTTQPRQKVFELAKGEFVYCIDSHVLLMPGSLRIYNTENLIHGVMYYDDLKTPVTHMEDKWQGDMWGVWGSRVPVPEEPFEIKMHGLGFFGSRKDSWLGFNPGFKGFGGEEGYIHEKYRQAGRTTICVPWIKWVHRFNNGVPYPLNIADRVRNYLIGFDELGLNKDPIYEHFGQRLVNKIESKRNL